MSQYFVRIMGEVKGPYSQGELKDIAISGMLQADSEVRQGENGAWQFASSVDGLLPKTKVFKTPKAKTPKSKVPKSPGSPPKLHSSDAGESQVFISGSRSLEVVVRAAGWGAFVLTAIGLFLSGFSSRPIETVIAIIFAAFVVFLFTELVAFAIRFARLVIIRMYQ